MYILLAEKAGFCFGVKRAIQMAEEAVRQKAVLCRGPLIHNPKEVKRLESLGIKTIEGDIGPDQEGIVLIRTHGAAPDEFLAMQAQKREVLDATCPFVQKAQKLAQEAHQAGYQVIILGDPDHVEVQGIRAWTGHSAQVVSSLEDLEAVVLQEKVAVLAQTTEREEKFAEVVRFLKDKVLELKVLSTICSATMERQKAAGDLAQKTDLMIVIGGKNSSNTVKLWQVCQKYNPHSYLIEEGKDLDRQWFKDRQTIGVTAGASTPAWIIKEVLDKMEAFKEQTTGEQTTEEQITGEQTTQEQIIGEQTTEEQITGEQTTEEQITQEQITGEQITEEQLDIHNYQPGEVIRGKVVKIAGDEVLVDIGAKSEGIIPIEELNYRRIDPREAVELDQEIMVEIIKEDKEGNIILSRKNALTEESLAKLEEAQKNGSILEAVVIEAVKGGLLVDVGVRGFVPASQIGRGFIEDLSQFLHQELRLKVLEIDRDNKKAVLSQRAVLEEEARQKKEALWESLQEGEIRPGTVKRLAAFGAFVDIGGMDGLLHVSEMGWGRINNPADVVKEGDEIEVEIIKIDRAKEKISLSLKKLIVNPWDLAMGKYRTGMIVDGKVARIAPFGAFIELEPGVEGLVHISQLASKRVSKVEDVLNAGQKVSAKIMEIDPEKKRIGLSIKEIETDAEKNEYATYLEQQDQRDTVTIGEAIKNSLDA